MYTYLSLRYWYLATQYIYILPIFMILDTFFCTYPSNIMLELYNWFCLLLTSIKHDYDYIWYLPCIVSLCGGNSGDIQNLFGKKRRPWWARCRGQDSITLWCNYQSLLSGWTVSLTPRQTSMYIITCGFKKNSPFRGLNIILRPNDFILQILFSPIVFIILTKAWIQMTVLRK